MSLAIDSNTGRFDGDDPLFERIAGDIQSQGWSVIPNALPIALSSALLTQLQTPDDERFTPAGVGRSADHVLNPFVRRDEICWIEGRTAVERDWLNWSNSLRLHLNKRLFLGLFSFESHFAHYRPGAFYKKHVDAFKNQPFKDGTNRVLSVVAYFNPGWLPDDGGELVMYDESGVESVLSVTPAFGTLVVFLSEDVPHEVKPARRDRFSIAGWYRVNSSQLDLPR
ncbi:MAG: 2OG-Fe(II) oxygenase [Gammaproteobacteria bacterium]|nr:2OG-Fe(II) oxygenase [Gammaproteobacteria bacterium]MDP2142333.1 2OG-Fe(II) oxygenase [Gammaproteobacteria bacterium]MDP2348574.1 2OG-Fe(II) oxygenase [Gammaproteobacteria bacterium]